MGLGQTVLLGTIAAVTIVLGMPVGRLRSPAPALRLMLNAVAIGVLLFLLWDVLSAAWEPIDAALAEVAQGNGGLSTAVGYGALATLGLGVGLLGLVRYERWLAGVHAAASAPGSVGRFGPGAMATAEARSRRGLAAWTPGRRLALLIAVGIGLHNFAEGLAIGQSAAAGQLALATVLVVGFALHNATEGFGIVAPLAAGTDPASGAVEDRPSWAFLLMLAAIGGGPTLVGTVVGHSFTSEPVAVAFLTLAAGSIIYVIVQLLAVASRSARRELIYVGLLVGLLAGFLTDAVVTAGGI